MSRLWARARFGSSPSDEIGEFEKQAANAGLYAFQATSDDVSELETNPQAVEDYFLLACAEVRVERWLTLAAERLAGTGVRLIINCGNDDPLDLDDLLRTSEIAVFAEGRTVEIDERRSPWSVLGLPIRRRGSALATPPRMTSHAGSTTPWTIGRAASKEARVQPALPAVRLGPRHGPTADRGYVHGDGGWPARDDSRRQHRRAGRDRAVPADPAPLHGHIHEGRGVTKIGPSTLVVNPGSEYPDGILRGAIIDLDANGIKGYVLTSG